MMLMTYSIIDPITLGIIEESIKQLGLDGRPISISYYDSDDIDAFKKVDYCFVFLYYYQENYVHIHTKIKNDKIYVPLNIADSICKVVNYITYKYLI